VPVSKRGGNNIDNLYTACFDCNRGKSNTELSTTTKTIEEKLVILREKELQYTEFKKFNDKINQRINADIREVEDIYSSIFAGWEFSDKFRLSVKPFIVSLGVQDVRGAMEKACTKMKREDHALKYFCGICWNKIKGKKPV
jgi:hypothetical protein